MKKKKCGGKIFCFFNIVSLAIFFCFIVGVPISKIYLDIDIERYIELICIFSTLFVFEMLLIFFMLRKNINICETEMKDESKLQLLREVFFDSRIKIDDEQKEIYKIFCNTLVDLY